MSARYWTHTIHPVTGPMDGWSDTPGEAGHTPPPEQAPAVTVTETKPVEKPAKEPRKHGKRTQQNQ
jgi:hypothetical protein